MSLSRATVRTQLGHQANALVFLNGAVFGVPIDRSSSMGQGEVKDLLLFLACFTTTLVILNGAAFFSEVKDLLLFFACFTTTLVILNGAAFFSEVKDLLLFFACFTTTLVILNGAAFFSEVKDLLFRILHHSGEVPNLCR